MPAAVIALAGALVYGAADFLGGLAARRLRAIVVTAASAGAGLLAYLVVNLIVPGTPTGLDVAWGVLAGFFGIAAVALLYACLALGPMSILSPLTAVVSAIAPIGWGLFVAGETLAPAAYVGLAVALVAVVLVGFVPGEKVVRPGVRALVMAVGAGAAIGGFLIVIDQTSAESGLAPLIASRTTSTVITALVVVALMVSAIRRGATAASALRPAGVVVGVTPTGHADLEHAQPVPASVGLTDGRGRAWGLALACGVADATANAAMLLALRLGDLAIVSALTALYPAGTILLAGIVLRERLAAVQWTGLALALVAGVLLATA
jgi:drug/metabolite transporter (DMT)-like permease